MDIAGYKVALRTWVADQCGIGTPLAGAKIVQWRDEKGGWQSKPRIRLHLKNPAGVGIEHTIWEQDEDLEGAEGGADTVPTIRGDRTITLEIDAESRDQDGDGVAIFYLMKLKLSLRKPTVQAALRDAGLAFSTSESPLDISSWVDGRLESRATMDIHFNAIVEEIDTDEAQSFVETFGIAAELTTPAGDDVGWEETEFGDI